MTGIQNAAFWQKKGTQSETTYNTFLYLCVGRGGGGGGAGGLFPALFDIWDKWIFARPPLPF